MKSLSESDIIAKLQEHSKGEIYIAYFTRRREYEYFVGKYMDDVVKKVKEEGDIFEMYPEIEDGNKVSFRSDEWIIFGNAEIAKEFKEIIDIGDNDDGMSPKLQRVQSPTPFSSSKIATPAPPVLPKIPQSPSKFTIPSLPTSVPSKVPSIPTSVPSKVPSIPTSVPSKVPSIPISVPSKAPSIPISVPSKAPSIPTSVPSKAPSIPIPVPPKVPSIPTPVPKIPQSPSNFVIPPPLPTPKASLPTPASAKESLPIPASPKASLPIPSGTGFKELPKDIKKMILYEKMEPREALITCEKHIDFECDWQKLLDNNYDFVTQGFAPTTDLQDRFKYLAERISKNVKVDNPEIIFIHFNGIPLGKKRFLEVNTEDEYEEEYIADRKKMMSAIIESLKESNSVEWVRRDDYNTWAKIKNPKNLPKEIKIKEGKYTKILRDNVLYDYPRDRETIINEMNIPYPGRSSYEILGDPRELYTALKRVLSEVVSEDDTTVQDGVNMYILEGQFGDMTPEYAVYSMMTDGIYREDAELFIKAYNYDKKDIVRAMKKLYKIDVSEFFQK